MTSKKSFLARIAGANRQKAWMWLLSIITMLVYFPFVTVIYLNRVALWYGVETPEQKIIFVEQMKEAVCDALAFKDSLIICFLAIVFGIGLFGYLNNRSKVDMLKSIPVKHKTMFFRDYLAGLIIFIVPYIVSLVISTIIASAWGYMTLLAFKECIYTLFVNLVIFLFYYSLSIVCVCLTGNILVGAGLIAAVGFGPALTAEMIDSFKFFCFGTATGTFSVPSAALIPGLYTNQYVYWLKEMNDLSAEIKYMLPDLIVWIAGAVITMILSYVLYMNRPAEAMHKAVYSKPLRILIKLLIIPAAALFVAVPVYQSSADSKWITAIAAVIAAIIIGMTIEGIYAFDIKGAFKSLWSTALGAVLTVGVLLVFFYDLIGYDAYVPKASNLKSYALETYPGAYADRFDFKIYDDPNVPMDVRWTDRSQFMRDQMFMETTDAIVRLAEIGVRNNLEETAETDTDISTLAVFYRLKSGATTSRFIYINRKDPETIALLNEIVGDPAYIETLFTAVSQKEELDRANAVIRYSNGVGYEIVDADVTGILDAWYEDAQRFDYSKGLTDNPVGVLSFMIQGSLEYTLPVYSDYSRTIAMVKQHGGYLSNEFSASDIDSITVTNFHNEVYSDSGYYGDDPSVTVTIDDPEDIKELLKFIKPSSLGRVWNTYEEERNSYSVNVSFNSSYEYARKGESFMFEFTDEVPDWIKTLTE